jgi:hypothetical protein
VLCIILLANDHWRTKSRILQANPRLGLTGDMSSMGTPPQLNQMYASFVSTHVTY